MDAARTIGIAILLGADGSSALPVDFGEVAMYSGKAQGTVAYVHLWARNQTGFLSGRTESLIPVRTASRAR